MSSLLNRSDKVVWHPFSPLKGGYPILPVKSAKGVYLELEDGRKIIDAVASWWVNMYGHSAPELLEAFTEQYQKIDHLIFSGFTHEPAVKLSEQLTQHIQGNYTRAFFSDDGSTSVEVGVKVALQYYHNLGRPKTKIVSIDGAYHGDTFGVMSLAGKSTFFAPFNDLMFDVEQLPLPVGEDAQVAVEKFRTLAASGEIACFVFEPLVQGSAGMRMYSPEVLDQLIDIAKDHDIVTIADEVMTGFGRTGKLTAMEYCRNKADITAVSKGITGGILPLGVTLFNEKIMEAFQSDDISKVFYHGHSYTGNPLTCAVSVRSLEVLLSDKMQDNIARISNKHKVFLEKLGEHPLLKRAESRGTIIALEILQADTNYFNELKYKIYNYFLERDILLRPLGNVMYIFPPYVMKDEELDKIYDAILSFLEVLKSEM